jgi:PadR family transcriptional regulator PadR
MTQQSGDMLRGALELLILRTVENEPRHGYGIARSIERATDDAVKVEEGSLYPALYRMEKKGLLASEWGRSELGRRAKFYRITSAGRSWLKRETGEWARFTDAVRSVLLPGEV